MCVFRYIELGVRSPTLFNPQPAPFLLCFGFWKCRKKRHLPLISQGTLCQIYKSHRQTVSPCCRFTMLLRRLLEHLILVAVAKVGLDEGRSKEFRERSIVFVFL